VRIPCHIVEVYGYAFDKEEGKATSEQYSKPNCRQGSYPINREGDRDSYNTILQMILTILMISLIEGFMLCYGLICKYDISHRSGGRPKVAYLSGR
jgi:hypothetical protein